MTDRSDVFISYASEDRAAVARPLAEALSFLGLQVWYDEYKVRGGYRFREAIDQGVHGARAGVVILSPAFLRKGWPQAELNALVEREIQAPHKVALIAVLHQISMHQAAKFSATLAAKKAVPTRLGVEHVADEIAAVLFRDRTHGPVARRRHVLHLFNPKNSFPTFLVYNRAYSTPTPRVQDSTTEEWLSKVRDAFTTLERIGAANAAKRRATNYDPDSVPSLLADRVNLVAYGSSKINPCTGAMLETLNRRFGLGIRFVYEEDAAVGKSRSVFTPDRQNERVALQFQDRILKSQQDRAKAIGMDYGILVRARPSRRDKRLWIIFAGCRKNASVASRLLVFDAEQGGAMWKRLRQSGPLGYFAVLFTTRYSPDQNTRPEKIQIIDVVRME